MKLTFLGAAGTVTGSKYLLESSGQKILVDCGLFQGLKELRLMNWEKFTFQPSEIDAVLLTHAHIDHSGCLPLLVKNGFTGLIYCSDATFDLCKILLPDSGRIHEDDAERANRYGYTKHNPALPLYTEEDAENALKYFHPVPFAQKKSIKGEIFEFSLHRAGHILGASSIRVEAEDGTSILFSGDLGRMNDPIMKPPVDIQPADYIVVESTYGDRLHDTNDPSEEIAAIINRTVQRGGSIIMPAFAVGRAQSLLFYIYQLKKQNKIARNIPVYLDSPMATSATKLLQSHLNDHRLSGEICNDVCEVAHYTRTRDESKELDNPKNRLPKIIISASGMVTGGRVLHHLAHYIEDARHTIMLAGFQAAGTRGDRLARGEKSIKIHGQFYNVAAEIVTINSMSAHGDYEEIITWLQSCPTPPKKVFITHGETTAAESMKKKIIDLLNWDAIVPAYGYEEEI